VIRPFELEDRLTDERYPHFLQELPQLVEGVPLEVRRETWLQQYGARAHFGGAAFLSRLYPDRWIGRGEPGCLASEITRHCTYGLLTMGSQ
jgi:hypothetical protein